MGQRNFRASVGSRENILNFRQSVPSDRSATALELVYQAADVFRGMEDHARDIEARAQSLCKDAMERLRHAEKRAEDAERAQRDLIIEAERKLLDVSRALDQAQSRLDTQQDLVTAAEFRAQAAEAETRDLRQTLSLVEEAIRRRLLCTNTGASSGLNAVA